MNPTDRRYTNQHEWVLIESGEIALVGITAFAAESLGDVVFVELSEIGSDLSQFDKMGEIESVKAVSELYSPTGGRVIEKNEDLLENPQLVNDSPYESGWIIRVKMTNPQELDTLMTSEQYDALISTEH